jgi:hypothetical protein
MQGVRYQQVKPKVGHDSGKHRADMLNDNVWRRKQNRAFSGRQNRMLKNGCKPSLLPRIFQHQSISLGLRASLVTLEGVEGLVGVTNEWQTHLGFLRVRHGTSLGTVDGAGILLRDLINGEV